ncbi:MAG: MurR/RpiR family transcriptional regulator [Actinomycetota bacterium]|nr:MurR/RpiR family transcriptional regulator [Actinomycetota bacterium]
MLGEHDEVARPAPRPPALTGTSPPGVATVADRLRGLEASMTESERRIAEVVLGSYPIAGLQPVTRLADDAGVSAPTVLRLLTKLGFDGYGDFRDALLGEVASMLASPVNRSGGSPSSLEELIEQAADVLTRTVTASLREIDLAALERTVDALADVERPVYVGGGRMSWVLASHLAFHLQLVRRDVHVVGPESGAVLRAQLDLDEHAVVVLFDYRRYQASTVAFGRHAASVGAEVVLITDRYLSPLARHANSVFTAAVESPLPHDGTTGAFALIEVLAAATIGRLGPEAESRVARFDALEALEDGRGG